MSANQPQRRILSRPAPAPSRAGRAGPWVAGLAVGLQALLGGYLCVVVPAVAAFTATSGSTANNGLSWIDAARFGNDFWLLGHGAGIEIAGTRLSLVPLGMTLLFVILTRFLMRRASYAVPITVLVAWGVYVAGGGIALVISGGGVQSLRALIGLAAVSGIGLTWGVAKNPESIWLAPLRLRWKKSWWLLPFVRGTLILATSMLALGAVLTIVWLGFGADDYADILDSLEPGFVGGVVLTLLCVAYTPTLMVWAVCYLSGAGFSLSQSVELNPFSFNEVTLPAFPLLGALPSGHPPSWAGIVVLLPVIVSGVYGFWLQRRRPSAWWKSLTMSALVALGAVLVWTILFIVATGSIGPGPLRHVGPVLTGSLLLALEMIVGTACGTGVVRLFQWRADRQTTLIRARRGRSDRKASDSAGSGEVGAHVSEDSVRPDAGSRDHAAEDARDHPTERRRPPSFPPAYPPDKS